MPFSMYDLSVTPMLRGFGVLARYCDKAEAFTNELGIAPSVLIDARLAPDMFSFAGQIQRASDNAKSGVSKFAQIKAPVFPDNETTFEELRARIAGTVDFLNTVTPEQLEGSDVRPLDLTFRVVSGTMPGATYLLSFLMPNFYFHIATAHDILRHNGVKLGKRDYLGDADEAS